MASSRVTFPDNATFGLPAYLPDGQLAQGSWEVRVPASPICQASVSAVITVPARIQTWLNSVRLTKSGSHHFLAGTLDDQPAAGPLAGQRRIR